MAIINEGRAGADKRISIGIGISTGEVMAGIFALQEKRNTPFSFCPFILASRLEHLARPDQILICDETYQQVREFFQVEKMAFQSVKGLDKTV